MGNCYRYGLLNQSTSVSNMSFVLLHMLLSPLCFCFLLQLSSKCDNRLFRVCFDSPSIPHYPFLRAFSRPIRCVSRNRNHRTPAGAWKQKPSNPLFPLDGTVSPVGKELISGESRLGNNDAHSNGTVPNVVGVHVSPFLPGQPPLKRARYQEKDLNGAVYIETSTDRMGVQNGELKTSFSGTFQRPLLPTSPSLGSFGWPVYGHLPSNGPVYKSPTLESNGSLDMMNKQDVIKDNNSLDCGVPEIAVHPKSSAGGFSDLLVFKYCLENMTCRAAFLKAAITVRNDLDLVDFAGRVSHCTGCRHNGYCLSSLASYALCSGFFLALSSCFVIVLDLWSLVAPTSNRDAHHVLLCLFF